MVLVKNLEFFLLLAKKGQVKVFGDVLNWKLAFLVYKNTDLRKSQNLHFSKGKKIVIFSSFRFGKIGPEKVFGDEVNRKLASKDYKNIGLRKSQNLDFPKGAGPWFWSNIWNFFLFSFLAK